MKSTIKKRLLLLEKTLNVDQSHKCALIMCDPEILHTFDFSFVKADCLLILPYKDNTSYEKQSYSIRYH